MLFALAQHDLKRLLAYHSVENIGIIALGLGDVGFLPTLSYFGRIRGDVLNLTGLICGNRFGRGLCGLAGRDSTWIGKWSMTCFPGSMPSRKT